MLYIYREPNPSKQIIQPLECPKYFKVLLLFFQIDEDLSPNFLVPKTFSEFPPHQRSLVSNHTHKQRLTTYHKIKTFFGLTLGCVASTGSSTFT